jgi:hypothetical protein
LALNETGFTQSLVSWPADQVPGLAGGARDWSQPITVIAFCCARAANGHALIVLENEIMKWRRLMPTPFQTYRGDYGSTGHITGNGR